MELIYKVSAAALTAAAAGLLIRRHNPELSLLLSIVTVAMIFAAALGFARGIRELAEAVDTIAGSVPTLTAPVFKCLAVAIVTKLTAELCREASHSAAASAVDFAGTVCAFGIALPLILSMLNMLGGMV